MPNVPNQEEWVQYLRGGNNPLANPIVELSQAPVAVNPAAGTRQSTAGGTPGAGQQGEAATPTGATSSLPSASQGAAAGPAQPQQRPLDPGVLFPQRQNLYGTQGTTAERLFAPGEEAQQRVTGFIGQAGQAFGEKAGPTGQTFESRGGAGTLGQYVEKGEGLEAAKGLVSASYTGPKELSEVAETQKAQEAANQEMTRRSAMRTGGGVMALLTSAVPGLTPGMAQWEAQSVFGEPGYRQRAAREEETAGAMLSRLAEEEQKARDTAGKRANEEMAIQNMAREWLQGKSTGIKGQIQSRVQLELMQRAQMEENYRLFNETGNPYYLMQSGMRLLTPEGESTTLDVFKSPYWNPNITEPVNTLPRTGGTGTGPTPPYTPAQPTPPPTSSRGALPPTPTPTPTPTPRTPTAGEVLSAAAAQGGTAVPRNFNVLRGAYTPTSALNAAVPTMQRAFAAPTTAVPTDFASILRSGGATPIAPSAPRTAAATTAPITSSRLAGVTARTPTVPPPVGTATSQRTAPVPSTPPKSSIPPEVTSREAGTGVPNPPVPPEVEPRGPSTDQPWSISEDTPADWWWNLAGLPHYYEPGGIPGYVNLGGQYDVPAMPETVINQEEADQLNRISELLELQEAYAAAPHPYEDPWLTTNVQGWLTEEERRSNERKQKLEAAKAEWFATPPWRRKEEHPRP